MHTIKYPVTLDLKRDYHQVLIMKEGDMDSREIIVTVTDNGSPFDLSDKLVKFKWHKPDCHFVFQDCAVLENKAVITCSEQMLSTGGTARCELILYDDSGKENAAVLSTMEFDVSIRDSVIRNADIESSDEFGALNNLILSNKNLNEALRQLEADVKEAEHTRISNETTRISNETNRISAETRRQTDTANAITGANTAAANADTATGNANEAALAAVTATEAANHAVRTANTAIEKMEALMKNDNLIHTEDLGAAGGVATLDENGNIPASQLPGYVDDVLEGHATDPSLNSVGNAMCASGFILKNETEECLPETGKIYVDTDTNLQYRWTGSLYISTGSVLELGTTSSTAFPGNRGLSLETRMTDIEAYHHHIPAADIKFDNAETSLLGANVQNVLEELSKEATPVSKGLLSAEDKKRIDNYANVETIQTVLCASNWLGESAPFTQTVTVPDLSTYNNCSIELPETASANEENAAAEAEISGIIYDETTGLTFTANGRKPEIDLPLQISVGTSINVVEIPKYFGETPVVGVKGAAEADYRNGNVTITKENIGLEHVDNTADSDKRVSYAASAGNADTVDGYHVNPGTSAPYGKIPSINSNGVMEIGKYMDFHSDNSGSKDCDVRLEVSGSDNHLNSSKYMTAPYFQCHTGAQLAADGNVYGSAWGGWLSNAVNKKLDKSGGTVTGDIVGGSGGRLGPDGNVYINCHGYSDYLTNILNGKLSTSASCNKNWNWSGQGGQPTWVWGGNDGTNMYVYNPSNFNVAYATQAHQAIANDRTCYAAVTSVGGKFSSWNLNGTAWDACLSLGSGSNRWKQLYSTTASISTSDKNMKKDIQPLTESHLSFFLKLQPVSFLFKDGESGRTHVGFIAQDVEKAMAECGLTALDFAGFCKDIKTDDCMTTDESGEKIFVSEPILDENGNPEYIYSLRYEEFIAINTYAIQRLYQTTSALADENTNLKTQIQEICSRLDSLEAK